MQSEGVSLQNKNFWFSIQCMGWTWYLANDFQLYAFAPILIIALHKWVDSKDSAFFEHSNFQIQIGWCHFRHFPAVSFLPDQCCDHNAKGLSTCPTPHIQTSNVGVTVMRICKESAIQRGHPQRLLGGSLRYILLTGSNEFPFPYNSETIHSMRSLHCGLHCWLFSGGMQTAEGKAFPTFHGGLQPFLALNFQFSPNGCLVGRQAQFWAFTPFLAFTTSPRRATSQCGTHWCTRQLDDCLLHWHLDGLHLHAKPTTDVSNIENEDKDKIR